MSGYLRFRIKYVLLGRQNLVFFLEFLSDVTNTSYTVLQLLIYLLSDKFIGLPCQTQELFLVFTLQSQIFNQVFVHQIDELLPEFESKVSKS